jgi:hypothetical protein
MCDYSLQYVSSRLARVGDHLVTTSFAMTTTRGFATLDEPNVAVCLLPGTEVAFEHEVQSRTNFFPWLRPRKTHGKLARFHQVNTDRKHAHHDALEFPDGTVVLLTNLHAGQRAKVLQLPPNSSTVRRFQEPETGGARPQAVDAVATWINTPFGF